MTLQAEIVKLLIQVAWADGEIAAEEVEHVLVWAREANLPPDELRQVQAGLRGEVVLSAPNLGYLRQHRNEALLAVQTLVKADGHVDDEEHDILDQVRQLLED